MALKFRSFYASAVTNQKQQIAKYQLKCLPNPLKDYPKKVNKYSLFLKEKVTSYPGKKTEAFKALAQDWKEDKLLQKVFQI